MSDEQSMEIIENLSEELGEKELKIMALEKQLEEEKKQKLEYYDITKFQEFKIDFLYELGENDWGVNEVIEEKFTHPNPYVSF